MYGIDVLMEEHRMIEKLIGRMRRSCMELLAGADIDVELFRKYVTCAREYADKAHHGKEEQILFQIMTEQLGEPAQKLIYNGMLVEHDQGRLYLSDLAAALDEYESCAADATGTDAADTTEHRGMSVDKEQACKLDVIVSAGGYCRLLQRHIEKEDGVVYPFAERMLSDQWKQAVNERTEIFENDPVHADVKKNYEAWLS